MASGYTTGGVDLDALFKPRTGAARANVGYRVAGVDLAQRYEQRSTAAIANTGFRSGGVDLAQLFENIGGLAVQVQTGSYTRRAVAAATTALLEFTSAGACNGSNPGNLSVFKYNWLIGGSASQFDIRVTPTSGSFSSGSATGTWLSLASTRTWNRNTTANNATSVTSTVEIRNASTLAVMSSATVTITADGSP